MGFIYYDIPILSHILYTAQKMSQEWGFTEIEITEREVCIKKKYTFIN